MGVLLVVALWPEAIDVEVGSVTRGALVVSLSAQGDTRVHHRLIVTTPVAGTLEPIGLEPWVRIFVVASSNLAAVELDKAVRRWRAGRRIA